MGDPAEGSLELVCKESDFQLLCATKDGRKPLKAPKALLRLASTVLATAIPDSSDETQLQVEEDYDAWHLVLSLLHPGVFPKPKLRRQPEAALSVLHIAHKYDMGGLITQCTAVIKKTSISLDPQSPDYVLKWLRVVDAVDQALGMAELRDLWLRQLEDRIKLGGVLQLPKDVSSPALQMSSSTLLRVLQAVGQAHAARANFSQPSDALVYCKDCHAYTALFRCHKRTSRPISKSDAKVCGVCKNESKRVEGGKESLATNAILYKDA